LEGAIKINFPNRRELTTNDSEQVLKESGKRAQSKSYLWLQRDDNDPYFYIHNQMIFDWPRQFAYVRFGLRLPSVDAIPKL